MPRLRACSSMCCSHAGLAAARVPHGQQADAAPGPMQHGSLMPLSYTHCPNQHTYADKLQTAPAQPRIAPAVMAMCRWRVPPVVQGLHRSSGPARLVPPHSSHALRSKGSRHGHTWSPAGRPLPAHLPLLPLRPSRLSSAAGTGVRRKEARCHCFPLAGSCASDNGAVQRPRRFPPVWRGTPRRGAAAQVRLRTCRISCGGHQRSQAAPPAAAAR